MVEAARTVTVVLLVAAVWAVLGLAAALAFGALARGDRPPARSAPAVVTTGATTAVPRPVAPQPLATDPVPAATAASSAGSPVPTHPIDPGPADAFAPQGALAAASEHLVVLPQHIAIA